MSKTKTCYNCAHSRGFVDIYKTCARTGRHCDCEMSYGGRCAGPATGVSEMNLWEPSIMFKVVNMFKSKAVV